MNKHTDKFTTVILIFIAMIGLLETTEMTFNVLLLKFVQEIKTGNKVVQFKKKLLKRIFFC